MKESDDYLYKGDKEYALLKAFAELFLSTVQSFIPDNIWAQLDDYQRNGLDNMTVDFAYAPDENWEGGVWVSDGEVWINEAVFMNWLNSILKIENCHQNICQSFTFWVFRILKL